MLTLESVTLAQGAFRLRADWSLPQGARAAVIGPSGAGKSTLLMAVAGFLAPESGRILWQGRDLAGVAPGDRPLSILFQDQNLFPHLTVAQNIGLGLRPDLRLTAGDHARIEKALSRAGLEGLGARRPAALSGGQMGRAALARVLLRALVAEVASETGATVLMVTHDPEDARRFADRCILVADGLAAPPAETAALFADPPPALRAYLGARRG
jgi:thiamine transport system ATP-binding protein